MFNVLLLWMVLTLLWVTSSLRRRHINCDTYVNKYIKVNKICMRISSCWKNWSSLQLGEPFWPLEVWNANFLHHQNIWPMVMGSSLHLEAGWLVRKLSLGRSASLWWADATSSKRALGLPTSTELPYLWRLWGQIFHPLGHYSFFPNFSSFKRTFSSRREVIGQINLIYVTEYSEKYNHTELENLSKLLFSQLHGQKLHSSFLKKQEEGCITSPHMWIHWLCF